MEQAPQDPEAIMVIKFYVIDSLAYSVSNRQIDMEKATELLESWFPQTSTEDIASLYRTVHMHSEV